MDDRLAIVSDEIKRLQREYDDAEWEGDPRSTELAKELNYYNKLHEQGVVFEPKF
jgi:hypothetical protein